MNQVNLIGRLTDTPELKIIPSGSDSHLLCRFTLAINEQRRGIRYTEFIDCIAWGKTAELIINYTEKGQELSVRGRLQVRRVKREDGTWRTYANVNVERMWFIGSRKDAPEALDFEEPADEVTQDEEPE